MGWTPGSALLYAGLAALLGFFVVRVYRARELAVPGRGVLIALRVAALLVVLLLLFDPPLPGAVGGPPSSRTLWDASASMELSDRRDPSAAEADLDGPAVLFDSLLAPALATAAEAGARRVTVVSDLRLPDGPEAVRAAERLGLEVVVRDVGGPVTNAAVARFELPPAVPADAPVPAVVEVAATGAGLPGADGASGAGSPDSVTLQISTDDGVAATRRVALPAEGRRSRVELDLPATAGAGPVRWEARVALPGDVWPDDDARPAWSVVDPEEGALVLLSLAPDWEPRFLLPVLGAVTGLRTRGLVRVGPDRWLVMDGEGAAGTVDDARARREARTAEMLVVQGGSSGPDWLPGAASEADRLLVLARSPADAALAGVEVGGAVPGEWYPAPDVPASPVASALAGVELSGLPPLGAVLPLRRAARDEGAALTTALSVRRGPGAAPEAGLVLRRDGTARRAVALAPGWWRWAFRPETGREPYRRVWSAAAGWLLAAPRGPGGALRPVERVIPRGAEPAWTAAGEDGDSVRLVVEPFDGDGPVVDTVLPLPSEGRFTTPVLPPGRYAWRGRVGEGAQVAGEMDVEAWNAELLHARVGDLARDAPADGAAGGAVGAGPPLRTHPLPYLLVLALLSAEWIGRRRRGLR